MNRKESIGGFIKKYWLPMFIVYIFSYTVVAPSDPIEQELMSTGDHLIVIFKTLLFGTASFVIFGTVFALIDNSK